MPTLSATSPTSSPRAADRKSGCIICATRPPRWPVVARGESSLKVSRRLGHFSITTTGEPYSLVMRQLHSMGWELPRDMNGVPDWFVAGATECCERTMIRLHGVDRTDPDPTARTVAQALGQLQDLAAWACCRSRQAEEPIQH